MDEDAVTAIVHALAAYLRAHPRACDSPEGIAAWWLQGEADISMVALEQSLDWMKRHGSIEEIVGPDGRRRYRGCGDAALDVALAARRGASERGP